MTTPLKDFEDYDKPAADAVSAAPARTPAYAHRQMRVKADRTLRIGARRYRPNEIVDGDVPASCLDAVEPVLPPSASPPSTKP